MKLRSSAAKHLFKEDISNNFKRRITGGFWNTDPDYPYKPHIGTDYGANIGEELIAYDDYEVIGINTGHSDYGIHIFLYFPQIDKTGHYAHMDSFSVSLGQIGKAKDVIGRSGNTGKSSGPHLHFGFAEGRVTSTKKGTEGNPWINFETYKYAVNNLYINLFPLSEHKKYGFYKLDVYPIIKNITGYLQPYNFNGLSYQIIEWLQPDVVKVKTRDFGVVKLYVDVSRSFITTFPAYELVF